MLLFINRSLAIAGSFILFIWLLYTAPAQAAGILRIAIINGAQEVKIGSSTPAVVMDQNGQNLGSLAALEGQIARSIDNNINFGNINTQQIWVEPSQGGYVWIEDKWYRGKVHLVNVGQKLIAVNHVNLEEYLYSVLGAEMGTRFPLEALKAQAVAARSYALHKVSTQRRRPFFDLVNTEADQVYKGVGLEANITQQAVNETRGQVMTYQGKIILAVFHSASGGHTEDVENVWSNPIPYLRGVPDYDQGTPGYQWQKLVTPEELSQATGINNIRSMVIDRTTRAGTILSMRVIGDTEKTFTGAQLRSRLRLRSARFVVNNNGQGFVFEGKGFGHGVGMSQWGAYNLAQQGSNYLTILNHYYRGVSISRLKS